MNEQIWHRWNIIPLDSLFINCHEIILKSYDYKYFVENEDETIYDYTKL